MEKACKILNELHCPFIINQNRYSIFDRTIEQNGLKESAARLQKGIIAFSPLAQGMLTDRYLHGIPEDSRIKTDGRFLHAEDLTEKRLHQIRALNEVARQPRTDAGRNGAQLDSARRDRDERSDRRVQAVADSGHIKALENTAFSEEEQVKIDQITKM